ncbi:MAG TPA: BatD family protein [Flavitalea sp.]|nr:BatD family protein [Flavitalea sp.]
MIKKVPINRLILIIALACSLLTTTAQSNYDKITEKPQVDDQSEIASRDNMEEKIRKNFFLRAEVSKTQCYVGEPIMATFKAYSRLTANSQVVRRPSLTGFSVVEMVDSYSSLPDVEQLDGKYYNVHLIRKVQLFPLQPGHFELEPAEVESTIHFRHPLRLKSASKNFNDLLSDRSKELLPDSLLEKKILSYTPVVAIDVLPLPQQATAVDSFSGAIGNFAIRMEAKDHSWKQNEPATVKLIISGTGNFPLITPPPIIWPKGIKPGDPRVIEETNKYIFPLSGTKVFEYTIDTRDTGSFEIPPIVFSYFDPINKTYRDARTDPFFFSIEQSSFNLKRGPEPVAVTEPLIPRQWYFYGFIVLVIIGWIIVQVVRSGKQPSKGTAKRAPAPMVKTPEPEVEDIVLLEDMIYPVKKALNAGDHPQFYQQLKQSVYTVMGKKFNLPSTALSKQSILYYLRKESADESSVKELSSLLDESELALYTPNAVAENMEEAYQRLETVLNKLTA